MSSSESSTMVVKPRPKLSDTPYNIKELIAENADLKTRHILRKVSTNFRAAVDTSKFNFQYIAVKLSTTSVDLRLIVEFRENEANDVISKSIKGEDFIQRAVNYLEILLKSPKVSVGAMWLRDARDENTNICMMQCLQDKFGSFRQKLAVGDLSAELCTTQDQVLQLLGLLKPGILKALILFNLKENCDRIVETEHWPFFEEINVGKVEGVPISKFLHLKKFRLWEFRLTKDDVKAIVQSILQRPDNFDFYYFCSNDVDMFPVWEEAISDYWPERSTVPIPGTDNQLTIKFRRTHRAIISFLKTDR